MNKAIGISLGIVYALLVGLAGCRVAQPGAVEKLVATRIKQDLTVGGRGDQNPLAASEDNIRQGKLGFTHHCAVCHGLDGQNTGVPFAENMSPPVPSLTSSDVQEYTDGQLKWVIENGVYPSGMPAWRQVVRDEEMWKIVLYLRHLPAKGSLGIPAIYQQAKTRTLTRGHPG